MKRIVLSIFFLFAVVWGWNTLGGFDVPAQTVENIALTDTGEAKQHVDQVLSALIGANSYADVSASSNSVPTNLVRRYRPAGFSFDKLFDYLTENREIGIDNTFKTFFSLSQEYFSHLKEMGYYIYNLRKIII